MFAAGFRDLGDDDPMWRAKGLVLLGRAYRMQGFFPEAKKALVDAFSLFLGSGDRDAASFSLGLATEAAAACDGPKGAHQLFDFSDQTKAHVDGEVMAFSRAIVDVACGHFAEAIGCASQINFAQETDRLWVRLIVAEAQAAKDGRLAEETLSTLWQDVLSMGQAGELVARCALLVAAVRTRDALNTLGSQHGTLLRIAAQACDIAAGYATSQPRYNAWATFWRGAHRLLGGDSAGATALFSRARSRLLDLGLKMEEGIFAADQYKLQLAYLNGENRTLLANTRNAFSTFDAEARLAATTEAVIAQPGMLQSSTLQGSIMQGGTMVGLQLDDGVGLDAVFEINRLLSSILKVDDLLQRVLDQVARSLRAERGALLLAQADGSMRAAATYNVDANNLAQEISFSVIGECERTGRTVLTDNAQEDARFSSKASILATNIRSVLCGPMKTQKGLLGVIYLDSQVQSRVFTTHSAELLDVFSTQSATALENAKAFEEIERLNIGLEAKVKQRTAELTRAMDALWGEMELAKKIQTSLTPKSVELDGLEVVGHMDPADDVGGDYYDVIRSQAGDWFVIGDVSGHGVTAGLVMMMTQTAVRTAIEHAVSIGDPAHISPAKILTVVNRVLSHNIRRVSAGKYITLTLLHHSKNGTLRYSGLHQDILVYRDKSKRVESVETSGMWIGIEEEIGDMLKEETLFLEEGDAILLYTDGIIEATKNGHMFDVHGLRSLFESLEQERKPAHEIRSRIIDSLEDYHREDDATLVLVTKSVSEKST